MRKFAQNSLVQGLVLAALYFLTSWLGVYIRNISGLSSFIWLPCGVGLAALVLLDLRLWPWIFLGNVSLSAIHGRHWDTAVANSAANAFECWLGAKMFRKYSSQPTLTRLSEVLVFVSLVVSVSTMVGSSLKIAALYLTGALAAENVFTTWRAFWISDAVGELVIGGALICWWNDIRFRIGMQLRPNLEMLALALALAGSSLLIFTPLAAYNQSILIKPYLMYSLTLWAALRYDVFGATSASLLVAMISVYGAARGFMPLPLVPSRADQVAVYQLFQLTWGAMGLILAAAIREKQEAVEARNEFLSVASHELRTPITSLRLQFRIFQRDLLAAPGSGEPSEFKERQVSALSLANRQVTRLTQIVDQLLDISRIDRRSLVLRFENVNLTALLRSLVERLSTDLSRAGCEVALDLNGAIEAWWDPFRIEQVFENLLSNAIKYAPGKPIRIAAAMREDCVEVTVSDRGPGIDEAKQPYIFDRFFRASPLDTTKGLGLGLFISRQIVEAHGGEIWVSSRIGDGTSFHVRLPLTGAPPMGSPGRTESQ